jgi:hypothetical protein
VEKGIDTENENVYHQMIKRKSFQMRNVLVNMLKFNDVKLQHVQVNKFDLIFGHELILIKSMDHGHHGNLVQHFVVLV